MKLLIQKRILFAFITLVVLFLLPALAFAGQHRVIRVVDGDTIIVDYYGKAERVRLLCVDTPESVHPDPSKNEPMGKVASDYTKARLERQHVNLEFESERQRDRYNRLLAYVFLDRQNFNIELVREGLSPYYTRYGVSKNYDAAFRAAEKFARDNKKGVWADPGLAPRPPPETESFVTFEDHYFASRNSQVFHRPGCESVEKIASRNLIEFKTSTDAIRSGRRPCKGCSRKVIGIQASVGYRFGF